MSKTIALATQHGKLAQIAPHFDAFPEWAVKLAEIDTDVFGTFSGEIPRKLSPRETAIEKARAGAEMLGCDYGLASEGSIGPHPQIPWVTADHELLTLVCLSKNIVVVESHLSTEIQAHKAQVSHETDIDQLIAKLDLPQHGALIHFTENNEQHVIKGVLDPNEFTRLLKELSRSTVSDVHVENDFRAMNSPTRQANISVCAEKLVHRINSTCPECQEIGWGKIGYEYGLPCSECLETVYSVPHSDKLGCVACNHTELVSLGKQTIDPARCDYCNP
jgi:ribosomal protein S27AE